MKFEIQIEKKIEKLFIQFVPNKKPRNNQFESYTYFTMCPEALNGNPVLLSVDHDLENEKKSTQK